MIAAEEQDEAVSGRASPANASGRGVPEPRASLVDSLLIEQAELSTAAACFSDWHDTYELREPAQAKHYRGLIPLNKPAPGEQYAFEVNLDQCTGCKACVAACHSLNGLDDDESWRDVGVIIGDTLVPYQQTVTTACHHCLDPACANGCPVLAYEKDPVTGIVRHLDDQCIGCSYCILKCPYDVPKFNLKRGIVRKCDMCQQRLGAGEAPACAQSCPGEAIAIRIVRVESAAEAATPGSAALLPGAFPSAYTKPTTRYVSACALPAAEHLNADGSLHLEDAHWPLAWMLVLTQLAAGLFCAAVLMRHDAWQLASISGFLVLVTGLFSSVLHLGQPLRAWRCFLGWRRSWLSREILMFGGFSAIAALACISGSAILVFAAALAGLLGVLCSAMVYVDTRRAFWSAHLTFTRFFGSVFLLGSSATAVVLGFMAMRDHSLQAHCVSFVGAALAVRTVLFAMEQAHLRRADRDEWHSCHRSARVMHAFKQGALRARVLLFVVSTVSGLVAIAAMGGFGVLCASVSFLATFASQVLEKHLFFVAASAPRMPGVQPQHSA